MRYAIQWVRSLIFVIHMYFAMAIVGIVFFIPVIFSRRVAIFACRFYCLWVQWSAG